MTDPPIKALRRFIPPLRIGNFALDLSFIIVLVAAYILLSVTAPSSDGPRRPSAVPRGVTWPGVGEFGRPPASAIVRQGSTNDDLNG